MEYLALEINHQRYLVPVSQMDCLLPLPATTAKSLFKGIVPTHFVEQTGESSKVRRLLSLGSVLHAHVAAPKRGTRILFLRHNTSLAIICELVVRLVSLEVKNSQEIEVVDGSPHEILNLQKLFPEEIAHGA